MNPNHYLAVAIQYLYGGAAAGVAPTTRSSARRSSRQLDDRPGGRRPRAHARRGARRVQVVRAGAARRVGPVRRRGVARARRSCAVTARCGPPTRTASSWPCSPRRSSRVTGKSPSEHYAALVERLRRARVRPHRRRRPPARRRPGSAHCPRTPSPPNPRWGAVTAKLTEAPGNGAAIGGLKVVTESRLVRGPPVRHRGRLQDLRRVLPRPGAPRPGAGRRPRTSSRQPSAADAPGARPGAGAPRPHGPDRTSRRHPVTRQRHLSTVTSSQTAPTGHLSPRLRTADPVRSSA